MGWNDFRLPVVGTQFENEDGSSRQEELARCEIGEAIELRREPDNPHDERAVALVTTRGIRVGYLARDRAVWMASKIDRGMPVQAVVDRVKGSHMPGAVLGLVVCVNMDGEWPEVA